MFIRLYTPSWGQEDQDLGGYRGYSLVGVRHVGELSGGSWVVGVGGATTTQVVVMGRYDDDPLIQARRIHVPKYQGHPDGRCCITCEDSQDHPVHHVTW